MKHVPTFIGNVRMDERSQPLRLTMFQRMGRDKTEHCKRRLVVGYLFGITSERRLMEELRMHLAYRWFTRLSFDQEIPDHSTFSKNRHSRFRQSGVFRKVFEEIVQRCLEAGLVEGRNLAVGWDAGGSQCQPAKPSTSRTTSRDRTSFTNCSGILEITRGRKSRNKPGAAAGCPRERTRHHLRG
jgi:hypothetical protein